MSDTDTWSLGVKIPDMDLTFPVTEEVRNTNAAENPLKAYVKAKLFNWSRCCHTHVPLLMHESSLIRMKDDDSADDCTDVHTASTVMDLNSVKDDVFGLSRLFVGVFFKLSLWLFSRCVQRQQSQLTAHP